MNISNETIQVGVHPFNGGKMAFSQCCFSKRESQIFFCMNNSRDVPNGDAEIFDENGKLATGGVKVSPVNGSISSIFEVNVTFQNPGRYVLHISDDFGNVHKLPLTVLGDLVIGEDNPFNTKDDKYSIISRIYFEIIKYFSSPNDRILEAGSSTGHLSLELGKMGYNFISLIDVLPGPIDKAKKIFSDNGVEPIFHVGDFLDHRGEYDFVWNTGLICSGFEDSMKERFIKKSSEISPKLLVICGDNIRAYSEIEKSRERENRGDTPRGGDPNMPVGVGSAVTYPGLNVPTIFSKYYDRVFTGMLSQKDGYSGSERFWTYGENKSPSLAKSKSGFQ